MKHERLKNLPQLKKEIISYLFDFVARKRHDTWYQYKGEFKYEGNTYNLECKCKWDNQMFTYRDLFIEHKQVEISIDDMIKAGLIQ